jgi:hypothetical protein
VIALALLLGTNRSVDLALLVLAGLLENGEHHDRAVGPAPIRYPDRHPSKPNPQFPDLPLQVI